MLHTRTNKSDTTVEILKIEEVAFIRGKLDDRKYKTQVFLKCGTIIHMNLDKEELQKLRDSFENANGYGLQRAAKQEEKYPETGVPYPKQETGVPVEGPSAMDEMVTLDNLISDLDGQ
jgi:hypothetical protein